VPPAPVARAPEDERAAAHRSARNRRLGRFFALVAMLAIVAAIAIALLSAESGGRDVSPIDRDDVQGQIDGIDRFLDRYSR
jgi:hypothetical protein